MKRISCDNGDGMFVSFEGGEGSGKSTLVEKLYQYFKFVGIPVIKTNDPGATELGLEIRKILLDQKWKSKEYLTELYLYHACRVELVNKIINPALKEGKLILCDRFFDSTWVYQGNLRGWDPSILNYFDNLTNRGLIPDLTILCDVDAKEGLERSDRTNTIRLRKNGNDESFWENMGLNTHQKINDAFRVRARKYPDRFFVIDTNTNVLSEKEILLDVVEKIELMIK